MRVQNGANSHLAQPLMVCDDKNNKYTIRGTVIEIVPKYIPIGSSYINVWSINIGVVGIFWRCVIPEEKTVNVIYKEPLNFGMGDYIQISEVKKVDGIFQATVPHTSIITFTQVPPSIY
jgi:hypothetical protein